jgi:hypothetical protein
MGRWGQLSLLEAGKAGDPRRPVRPAFIVLIVLTMLVSAGVTILTGKSGPSRQPSDQVVATAFREIPAPQAARSQHDVETRSKTGAILVIGRYLVRASADSVLSYYQAELSKRGWVFHKPFQGGENWGRSYCRGNLLASIEIMGQEAGTDLGYVFSVSWNEISEKECAR